MANVLQKHIYAPKSIIQLVFVTRRNCQPCETRIHQRKCSCFPSTLQVMKLIQAPLQEIRNVPSRSLTTRPQKVSFPIGKACLPTTILQGRTVQLRGDVSTSNLTKMFHPFSIESCVVFPSPKVCFCMFF